MNKNEENSDNPVIENNDNTIAPWKSLGIEESLCQACEKLNWKTPTPIQIQAIPQVLEGAFMIPIIQALLKKPEHFFALILTPTRELAFQIRGEFEAYTSFLDHKINSVTLVGGSSLIEDSLIFASKQTKPHVIIATPGRLVDHLENTNGFNLNTLKFLVMDEADKILNMDFEIEVDKIIHAIPRERRNLLFSATMTKQVQKLQRAALKNPIKVEVSTTYKTVDNLDQSYLLIPSVLKEVYLVHILNELADNSFIVFCATCTSTIQLTTILKNLGIKAIPLNGKMSQDKRSAALDKYKSKKRLILIATDVASLGLDIPHVGVVINYDIPTNSKSYVHRVGRTARAGRSGRAITFVTQFDVELYRKIEDAICKKLPQYETEEKEVMKLQERVGEARRSANMELNKFKNKYGKRKKSKNDDDDDDDDDTEQSSGIRKRIGKKFNHDSKKPKRKIR
ncbi:hypothetical protein HCN44_005662 [Aphidius gifuensis]|uniref:RNA helicase n=1 Tax=Aphidius gifuensis TaxID=684658 RepID=A0A835CY87_APHGI|nr:hypothetical protein HCN44_005662 [Aphidius gifuensis]